MGALAEWFSVAIAGLCAIASGVSVVSLLKHRTEALDKSEEVMRAELKEMDRKLTELLVLVKVHNAEQGIVNMMTAKTIELLTKKVEALETNRLS